MSDEEPSVDDLLNQIDARGAHVREVAEGHENGLSSEEYHLENAVDGIKNQPARQYLRGYIDGLRHAQDEYETPQMHVTNAAQDIAEYVEKIQDGDTE